jgi:ubiquinone/menaquinone biosynthesis C-methylase UbiE
MTESGISMHNENHRQQEIKSGYKENANKYDDYITSGKLWSKIIVKLIWGMRDEEYIKILLPLVPDELQGKLLDVPTGTAIFTYKKYKKMDKADIFCMDYSQEMLDYARERFNSQSISNTQCKQGDVGNIPFDNEYFDVVLSMNGFHAFPDKEMAFKETYRVLKPGGRFIGCFYIKGERFLSDFFVRNVFVRMGTFTGPFMTKKEVELFLNEKYTDIRVWNLKSILCFECVKK